MADRAFCAEVGPQVFGGGAIPSALQPNGAPEKAWQSPALVVARVSVLGLRRGGREANRPPAPPTHDDDDDDDDDDDGNGLTIDD